MWLIDWKPGHVYAETFRFLDDEVVMIATVGGKKVMLIKVDDDGSPSEEGMLKAVEQENLFGSKQKAASKRKR